MIQAAAILPGLADATVLQSSAAATVVFLAAAVFVAARLVFRMLAGILASLCAVAAGLVLLAALKVPALDWLLDGLADAVGGCAFSFGVCG